jgi:exodeoxyribonuclease VII large subunit
MAMARDRLQMAVREMWRAAAGHAERRRRVIDVLAGKLDVLSPMATMARGFAIVTDGTGTVVTSAARLSRGEVLGIRLQDGRVTATVDAVHPEPPPPRAVRDP